MVLSNNGFSNTLPNITNLTSLKKLDISHNGISGNPSYQMRKLFNLTGITGMMNPLFNIKAALFSYRHSSLSHCDV